jgi:hypothetical protein
MGLPIGTFILSLLYTSLIVLLCATQWIIFQKAGKSGWKSLIPVYSTIVLLQIIGKPWWWLFLLLIPVMNIIWTIWMINLLSKSFGKNEGFTVGLILLSPIFYPILAFGGSKYLGPAGAPGFNTDNPPVIPEREYNLNNWLIIIALLLIINGVFWFIMNRLSFHTQYLYIIFSVLFGTIPLISAGLLKNKTWRIILIILGTVYLAIQLESIINRIMESLK